MMQETSGDRLAGINLPLDEITVAASLKAGLDAVFC
jgi:hypothetical protein